MATTSYVLANSTGPVMPKASGTGIQVDMTAPSFPWRDILGDLQIKVAGGSDPSWDIFIPNIREWQFASGKEMWIKYHIPHDHVPGSHLYIHSHWCHDTTTVNGGTLVFGYNMIYSKGYNQAAFSYSTTDTTAVADMTALWPSCGAVNQADSTDLMCRTTVITEIQITDTTASSSMMASYLIEPDGLLLVRFYVFANNMTVRSGGVPNPFVHQVDLHYQSTNLGTKNKVNNFYT